MKLLKRLTETAGVPGREERIREVVLEETKGLFDETRVDPMGNLICVKRARGRKKAPSVMLGCHMDEIGFYVRHVDDNGFLRVQEVGGFDPRNLFARRVLVQGKKDLPGVLNPSVRPIHLMTDEEKKRELKVSDFYVDTLLPAAQVKRLVRVGDPVSPIQPMEAMGEAYTGKAMDDRVALWVGINAVRKAGAKSRHDIYFVATVQEEVGCRGAGTSSFDVDPDVAIALDVTLCCDTPGVPAEDAVTKLGDGVAIKIMDSMSISDRGLVDQFEALAKRKKIPYQLEILPRGGTDAATMQRSRAGRRTITLSVPCRYVHTVTETVHKRDLKAGVDLLAAWLTT